MQYNMQYILTEQEYKNMKDKKSEFYLLISILRSINKESINDNIKLKLYKTLINDLDRASENDTIEAILNAWENRKEGQH